MGGDQGMKLFVPLLVLMLVAVTSAADLDMLKEVHELDHGEAHRVNMVGEDDQGGRRAGGHTATATATTQYHPCAAGRAASGQNGLCVDCAGCAKGKHGHTVASPPCKNCVIGKYADTTGH